MLSRQIPVVRGIGSFNGACKAFRSVAFMGASLDKKGEAIMHAIYHRFYS
jgi:hypothetical protein